MLSAGRITPGRRSFRDTLVLLISVVAATDTHTHTIIGLVWHITTTGTIFIYDKRAYIEHGQVTIMALDDIL